LRVTIHQPQYLPYLGFFHKVKRCDVFIALDDVQFQKNGLQNRNKIKNANGWQWLTVPVKHRLEQSINEVEINARQRWGQKHWNALKTNYSKAEYFSPYAAELEALLTSSWNKLCPLNMALTEWAFKHLALTPKIVYSSELEVGGESTDRLVNLCKAVGGDCYLSGPGGRRYLREEAFPQAGLTLEYQQFEHPTYPQMFPKSDFVPYMSIVDALFCCGPKARHLI